MANQANLPCRWVVLPGEARGLVSLDRAEFAAAVRGRSVDGDGEAVEGVACARGRDADDAQVTLAGLGQDQPHPVATLVVGRDAGTGELVPRAVAPGLHLDRPVVSRLTEPRRTCRVTTNCSPLAGVESETKR